MFFEYRRFCIESPFLNKNAPKMIPKWKKKKAKNHKKIIKNVGLKMNVKKVRKWSPRAPKMEAKWSPNGVQMSQTRCIFRRPAPEASQTLQKYQK